LAAGGFVAAGFSAFDGGCAKGSAAKAKLPTLNKANETTAINNLRMAISG
jgi:hypothetical protein